LAASRFEHFALPAVAFTAAAAASRTSRFAGRAAIRAAVGLIGKALAGEKFLLTGREGELTSTVYTGQRFINVHILNESPSFGLLVILWIRLASTWNETMRTSKPDNYLATLCGPGRFHW
jgi:hypothetical protein